MITWLASRLGLSTLVVKLILSGAAIGSISFGLRLWSNRVWSQGYQSGKVDATAEVLALKKEEWAGKEKAIAAAAARVDGDRAAIDAQQVEIARSRQDLDGMLARRLAEISARKEAGHAEMLTLTGSDLDGAIRLQLAANLKAGAIPSH